MLGLAPPTDKVRACACLWSSHRAALHPRPEPACSSFTHCVTSLVRLAQDPFPPCLDYFVCGQTCVEFEQRVTYLAHSTPASLWEDVLAVYKPVTANPAADR